MSGKQHQLFLPAPRKGLNYTLGPFAGPDYTLDQHNLLPRANGLQHIGRFTPDTWSPGANTFSRVFGIDSKIFGLSTAGDIWRRDSSASGTNVSTFGVTSTFSTSNFSTGAGSFLVAVGQGAVPQLYTLASDTWANMAITGPTLAGVKAVTSYRKRLYFLENDKLGFWYLNPDAVAGAATYYNIGSLIIKGGEALAITTLSRDGGAGSDDLLVVLTSFGEVVVFSGNDPGSATWTPIGTYDLGPVNVSANDRVFAKYGGDVLVQTTRGILSLSQILGGVSPAIAKSLSAPINEASRGFGEGISIAKYTRVLTILGSIQFMMDLNTEGWATYGDMITADDYIRDLYETTTGIPVLAVYLSGPLVTWAPNAPGTAPYRLASGYQRFGQTGDWQLLQIRPWFNGERQIITLGACTDLSNTYKEKTIEATDNNWKPSGNFTQAFNTFGFTPEITWPWMTIGVNPGPGLSIKFSGTPPEDFDCFSYFGCDLRLQQEATPS